MLLSSIVKKKIVIEARNDDILECMILYFSKWL